MVGPGGSGVVKMRTVIWPATGAQAYTARSVPAARRWPAAAAAACTPASLTSRTAGSIGGSTVAWAGGSG